MFFLRSILICSFILPLGASQPLPQKNNFLAPKSAAQPTELDQEAIKFILAVQQINKKLAACWMEFLAADLNPNDPESLNKRADFVKRLVAIIKQSDEPLHEWNSYSKAKKLKVNYYLCRGGTFENGVWAIKMQFDGVSPDAWGPDDDLYMAFANVALVQYLQNFRSFALIVQKGEMLNFGVYFPSHGIRGRFGFANIKKLHSKPDVVPLPPELFSEIDAMIQPLPKKTEKEIMAEFDSRRAAAVNGSL